MTRLRFAYKAASLGTSAWLGWKLATLDNKVNDIEEQMIVHDDLLSEAYEASLAAEPVAS